MVVPFVLVSFVGRLVCILYYWTVINSLSLYIRIVLTLLMATSELNYSLDIGSACDLFLKSTFIRFDYTSHYSMTVLSVDVI